MKPFTPAEIRRLVAELRDEAENGHTSSVDTYCSYSADALEYLLQFVEWKPATDKPNQLSLMVYPPDGATVLNPRYGLGLYGSLGLFEWEWSMPPKYYVPLPPSPQEMKED